MDILGFTLTLLPIVISPGASFAIALNSTLNKGFRGLVVPIVGTGLGILTHGLLVGIGLTKIIVSSPWIFNLISILGFIYLIYLSIMLIYSGLTTSKQALNAKVKSVTITDAYLANLLNPKAIILYLVVVSNFAGINPTLLDFLFLSTIHIVLMSLWLIFSCGLLVITSTKIDVVKLKTVINIGGGVLLLLMTLYSHFCR
ncbi:LysE family translocator [Providencia burhodogranariea]|uniref:Efflux protein RhtB n=1 Tax=Providencia burhodogranariea DSM 19968 TaxID=1141662 RepID=K8WQX6_9GAMM|nr:LysE family translocator [Providencia burhodogranariea]EKT63023.1 efflux protein RhtB [Providencia burhodogranariea DSM 19968]